MVIIYYDKASSKIDITKYFSYDIPVLKSSKYRFIQTPYLVMFND